MDVALTLAPKHRPGEHMVGCLEHEWRLDLRMSEAEASGGSLLADSLAATGAGLIVKPLLVHLLPYIAGLKGDGFQEPLNLLGELGNLFAREAAASRDPLIYAPYQPLLQVLRDHLVCN
eukprot:CAMPEP_0184301638 /NCGR_PEP_ID=MMETSP1049-20130417/11792_1 /TAXON_ID=77928 /ORGANISM="Proteomonas sulcata, Strain CCMP704" /LENGTH=118 /DNA_ID=CAMNT_0026612691 /DNA_START=473 /DNA_END=826 /DNA_ORIENTATION=-